MSTDTIHKKSGWLYQLYQPDAATLGERQNDRSIQRVRRDSGTSFTCASPQDQCEVCVNGVRYFRFKLGDKDWEANAWQKANSPNSSNSATPAEGHICLQDHGNEVAYRNIKLRELGPGGSVPQPIDGQLGMKGELAFPNLKWDQWEAVDEDGKARPLRLDGVDLRERRHQSTCSPLHNMARSGRSRTKPT